jgi:hypothetical protein
VVALVKSSERSNHAPPACLQFPVLSALQRFWLFLVAVGQFFDCHSTGFLVTLPQPQLSPRGPSRHHANRSGRPANFQLLNYLFGEGGLGGARVFMNQLLTKLWSFGGLQGCFALLDMSWYLKCRPLKPSIFRIGLGSER